MKQGRNGNVGELRHMTIYFIFLTCLIMIKSDSVQDSFWSNHKNVSNSITYEHLRRLPLNNETTLCSSPSNTTHASPVAPCNTSTNAASHEDVTEIHPPIHSIQNVPTSQQ